MVRRHSWQGSDSKGMYRDWLEAPNDMNIKSSLMEMFLVGLDF